MILFSCFRAANRIRPFCFFVLSCLAVATIVPVRCDGAVERRASAEGLGIYAPEKGAKVDDHDGSIPCPVVLKHPADGNPEVLRFDLGEKSVGGYAVFDVTAVKGFPVLRVSYANHPDGLGEKGCFSREKSARYLGDKVDIPALPGNINRHEIYRICRTGRYVAPLIQGQERYVRLQLDTSGTEVEISSFRIENANVFRSGKPEGCFVCSDPRLDELWRISVWTCQLASFPDHNAWKTAGGRLLPRKLDAADGAGWCRAPSPCDGILHVDYEFDANPHFPKGRFFVLAGERRTEISQISTNKIESASVPIRKGERFGLALEKESWPVVSGISVVAADGSVRWRSRFDAPDGLDDWDFPRTLPYVADGAKRDRLIWSGDLWWAQRNVFYSFNPGNDPYMRGSVNILGFNQTPSGYVHACPYAECSVPPSDGEYGPFQSDEFAAWFVPVLYDYYLYSGDAATVRGLYPNVRKLMDYLFAHTAKDGTFVQRLETSKHACACDLKLGDTSHRSYMDILLWKCCRDAAALAADIGIAQDRELFMGKAAMLESAIRSHFWNGREGFFMISDRNRGFGFEANALALAVGFATADEALRIAPRLRHTGHGKFQALAVRGLMEYGYAGLGLDAIAAHNWFKILDPSWKGAKTTTECMALLRRGWGDESHPDTAIAGILSSELLGIEPTAPGYAKFEFRPRPCEKVTYASGEVPTPLGMIAASWRMDGRNLIARLSVPEGAMAAAVLPKCDSVTVNGERTADLKSLGPGNYAIFAGNLHSDGLLDLSKGSIRDDAVKTRYFASSSHEAPSAGWSIRNLGKPLDDQSSKGWSSAGHRSPRREEWVEIDLGAVKGVEKLDLYARDECGLHGNAAGFPQKFKVEGDDGAGVWCTLKEFSLVAPLNPGEAFSVDFYTVVGYPKVRRLKVRAVELGTPAQDEPGIWRLQFKRIHVKTLGS